MVVIANTDKRQNLLLVSNCNCANLGFFVNDTSDFFCILGVKTVAQNAYGAIGDGKRSA